MNNIYKVIWSKAKNCYVVASEIAKSHTKSASGSEKMGGYGKRALLALAAASAIFCGGLVNVGASVQSETISAGTTSNRVLTVDNTDDAAQLNKVISAAREDKLVTKDNIGGQLTDYAKASDLSAKADANDVYSKTAAEDKFATKTELGSYAKSADVYSQTEADDKFATKDALKDLTTTVNGKADTTAVTALEGRVEGVERKVTTLEGTVGDVSNGLVRDVNDLRTQGTALNNALGNKADKSELDEAKEKITTNETNITALQKKTTGLSEDGKSLNSMNNVETGALKVSGKISDGTVNTTLAEIDASMKQTETNKEDIANLKTTTGEQDTAIKDLQKKTTNISYADGAGTSIDGITVKDGNIVGNGNSAITGLTNVETSQINGKSLAGTTVATATEVETETLARKEADNKLDQKIDKEIQDRDVADAALEGKITTLDGKVTTDIADLKAKDIELEGRIHTNEGNIETNKNAIAATDKRTGGITRNDAASETTIEGHVTVDNLGNVKAKGDVTADGKLKGEGVDAGAGDITTTGAVNAGSLKVENASNLKGDVTMDKKLAVTGDTSLKKTDVDGTLNVTGESSLKNTKVDGTLTTTGKATFQEAVEMDKGLTVTNGDTTLKKTDVDGALTVTGESSLKNTTVGGTLGVTGATTLSGELKAEKDATFEKDVTVKGTTNLGNTTVEGDLKVTGTITTDKMVFGETPNNYTEIDHGKVTSKNLVVNGAGETISSSSTFDVEKNEVGFTNTATGDHSYHKQTAKGINGYVTDKDGNKTYTKVTATENSFQVQDKDGKNKNHQVNTKDSSVTEITNGDGKTTKTEQTAENITNTAKDGTIKNDAKDIVNNASGNISNKSQTMDTTVTGKATESYGSLDTTVNGNETHIVKGTKMETVDGKVTENYKAGQETNVTGNQDIKVSGTQTTTATDINRNASSSMVDKVDNAYGTNTETKEAGKTTTDVSIKGTGEKGQYIRGANESRDYLIKDTLMNSETKTAEATSTEITDGTNKASTRQDAKNLADSVTNGTEIGVSGIHANDDGSVSIDSAVAGGGMSSVINQKKDSIQSAVGDGTNSTVIHQDKDNVTIASSNGTVGIVGKDIVNNAQNTITNTAGTSITNQVNDSKVTTDANGTTFENNTPAVSDGGATTTKINGNLITTGRVDANELGVSDKDGANTADLSVKAGEGVKASAGNGTTTGSLDVKADEVVSSVKDADGKGSTFKQRIDAIMMESKDVSIKAEETLTNEAKVITNKASEVINNEAVNINNTATGIITSKASEIKNEANQLISNKVGENTWENMEDGKITTSIKNGTSQNLTQSDAEKTEHSVVNGSNSTVNKQTSEEITDAVTNGTTTNVTQNTATSSNNTIADTNGNANTVVSTVDGTKFTNTGANTAIGEGTVTDTTIKGNTITTGKVTMDYAEVMKNLGVRGNANIAGKTTTGELEVTGKSTLKGDVTMESNATVKKDLTVEGTTTTKTLHVTENATVGGTLDVAKKATFGDSVSIAKDLSVDGNATIKGDVTAKSYKVGDKTYISAAGINANDQKITNVADGSISEGSKDAVNGGQLYTVKNDLEGKVNKVGANAAAMANLHPMEFDPSSKWNIAAAIGNYGSETAAALGAFYRPNDDVMVNLSTAFGTGENMVGGGVSVRLGKGGNKLSREETNALKAQVADLTARMDALLSVLNPNMSKDFPDVPENHWAYEAVSRLAGNDIVQGYPDGEFHGERTMTRYEMAEIIYNALSRGAEAEKELVEEFKPELQAMAASEKATAEKAEG